MGRIRQFVRDVRRRRVLQNAAIYIVAAWVAIQVADLAIDAGIIRWSLRNFFFAAFLGFPVALIVSWFYDITRRGLARTPPASADASFDKSLHTRDYLLFTSLAVVWVVANVFVHTPAPVDKSIAILPFENPGHDPDNAMFAFGIRVDLQSQLQNLRDLKIIARESSDKIDRDMSLPEIGLKLGAAYIMRGSVERVLGRVRINVNLIDAEKEEQTWAGSYDRELTASNWFDIRNEISGVITDTLRAELSPAEEKRLETVPTENLAALQAYYHGKQRMAKRTVGTSAEAIDYFQQAVDLDPNFALAWVGLADSYSLQALYGGLPQDEMLPKKEAAIDKALELDDQLGEAYASLATLQWQKGDMAAAEAMFKRALELNPNYATAHQWYGSLLGNLGRRDEGLAQKGRAQALDPLSAVINHSIGLTLELLGRFDEALAQYQTVIEIDPAFPNPYEGTARIYWQALGQLDDAVVWFRKAAALDPAQASAPIMLAMIYLDLGDSFQAEFWFNRTLELAPGPYWPNAANEVLYYYRGEKAKAFDYGRKLLTIDPGSIYTLAHLRNDDLTAGRYLEARAWYERGYPALLQEGEPTIDEDNYVPAIDLALVLTRTGEQERADLLLDRSLTFLPKPRRRGDGYRISDALIYAQQGKTRAALAALRQVIDQGWREAWWFYFDHDPNLDSIRDEPEFQAMVVEIKADMATQLEHVRAMEANGKLEAIPDIE
jgi:TolB-like protein/Tfp pilus assembly protein PilF